MTYRELQATRVLSVDAYWQELREPSRRTPREIPVPLWPGESLQHAAVVACFYARGSRDRAQLQTAVRTDASGEARAAETSVWSTFPFAFQVPLTISSS
ncbi:hypothetical protein GQ600_14882 [Phytophthora cactorum]|nr:hypothetical protein GQ600_14882 [Phytophthora cactorum]